MSPKVDPDELSRLLNAAGGGEAELDRLVSVFFDQPMAQYTESVECCRVLVSTVLPRWHLHVGYGASGILPYASLSCGDGHHEAEAPTVPLAILRALLKASRS